MCDVNLISANQTDLHSCWIIYTKSDGKERLTVTDTKPMIPNANMTDNAITSLNNDSELDDEENDGTEQSLHEMLETELQPEQPIPNNAESQEIYREHRRLAKEHLRVVTKLYYAQDFKDKMLLQMDPAERQEKQELLKKMSEKEELLELYNNLKQQLEKIQTDQADYLLSAPGVSITGATPSAQRPHNQDVSGELQNDLVADDGWVVIVPDQNT